MKINKIINFVRNILLIIGLIFAVSVIILSCGLALIVFDYIKQEEEYDDWILMEEWKQKEEKEKLKMGKQIYTCFNMDT